jgi:arylsulfatase A-like enzyme
MKKRLFSYLIGIIAVFHYSACDTEDKSTTTPNILFIFADDQRADALGVASNPYIKTPNIDALAKNGTRFENCYVMGGHHGAICAPSRAMLLSGKSLFHVYDRLDGVQTLPNYLSTHGFQTFGTGKWHNGAASFEANFQEGREIMLGGMSDHFEVPVRYMDAYGKLDSLQSKGFSTDVFTKAALNYLDRYSKSKKDNPFFCYIAYTAPHDPRSPAPAYADAYAEDEIPVPDNFKPLHPFRFDDFNVRDETLAAWPRTTEVIQSSLAEYYALIQHIDNRVGDLIDRLKMHDLYDNTLIVYAADNGLALGSHGLLGKQNLYEHSTKVPLIISGPGIPEQETSKALVYLYDLFPTLVDYLQISQPANLDGKSLLNIIHKEEENVRTSLYTAYRNTVRAVRDKEWKLIRYPQIDETQLFNLDQDPHELVNLASDSLYQTKVTEMMEKLKMHHQSTDDTLNLSPKTIISKEYDYRTLVQKRDRWQPAYIINKYFPKEVDKQ